MTSILRKPSKGGQFKSPNSVHPQGRTPESGNVCTLFYTLLAELPELGQLDRRQIAALVGLVPFVRQSGKWRGKSMIAGGRASVRTALFMAAQVAKRVNPVLAAFYDRLIVAGKPKMVGIIAIAHKLLIMLNAMMREKSTWRMQGAGKVRHCAALRSFPTRIEKWE